MTPKERLQACERFLIELQSTIPEDERVIAGYAKDANVKTDAQGKKMNSGFWPVPWKVDKYIDQDSNAYCCISSSIKTPNPKNGQMRYWRGEASFGHGLAMMVDDIGHGKGSKGDLSVNHFLQILAPTAIVETSPGNHQLWYFLDVPEPSMVKFKSFLTSFVTYVLDKGGDNTIKDIARYGRMPIGLNNKRTGPDGPLKYPDANGKPWQVQLVAANYALRYSLEDIAHAFHFTIPVVVPRVQEAVNLVELKFDHLWLQMAEKACNKAKMGEGSNGEVFMNMSGKYRIRCPWGDEHTNGDPYGAYFRGPIPGAEVEFVFGCAHDGCRKEKKRTWTKFIDEMVMPKIFADLDDANVEYLSSLSGEKNPNT